MSLYSIGLSFYAACIQLSYLPDEYGLQLSLTLNGRVVFNRKISGEHRDVMIPDPFLNHDFDWAKLEEMKS